MDTGHDLRSQSAGSPIGDRNSCRSITEPGHGIGDVRIIQKQLGDRKSSRSSVIDVFQCYQEGLEMEPEEKLDSDRATEPELVEPFKYAGYLACILASITLSVALLCVKLLPVEDCISEKAKASFFRGLFMMLFCGMTIAHKGLSLKVPHGEYLVNLARAVLGGFNVFIAYISIQFITIGERSAISYLGCIWSSLLGFILLKEPLKLTLLVAIPVSFLGVVLIAMPSLIMKPEEELIELPPSDLEILEEYYFGHRWIGIVISLIGSFTASMSTIVLKFRKKTPIVTCSFYFGLAMVLVSVGAQMVVGFAAMPSTWLEWFLLVCIGFLSYVAQCLVQWALQFVPAGTFSTILSIQIVTSYIMSVVFLHELVLWTSLAGSVLIMSVVIMLIFNDRIVSFFHQSLRGTFKCDSSSEKN